MRRYFQNQGGGFSHDATVMSKLMPTLEWVRIEEFVASSWCGERHLYRIMTNVDF